MQATERFHRIANSVSFESDAARSYYGNTAAEMFSRFGRRVRRKIIALFSALSDEEITVACNALAQEVFRHRPDIMSPNPLKVMGDRFMLIRMAEVIAILAPTFVKIAPPGTPLYRTFSKVLETDMDSTNAPPRQWCLRSFSEQRINLLHGRLMHAVALTISDSPRSAHSEWFGENRDSIIPLWDLLVKDDVFSPERVQILLENVEHGATGVLGGAL